MITINNLSMVYRSVSLRHLRDFLSAPVKAVALDRLNLSVPKGKTCAVLGENGAGKTTLLKILSGLIIPASGSVTLGGIDLLTRPREAKQITGYVQAEERSFYWRLSGRKNLQFFASLYGLSPQETKLRIASLSELLRLNEWLDLPFRNLSTGIRQRFSLARGLIRRPRILLLDEPTRSLDPWAAADFIERLDDIRREHDMTILLATHSMRELESADHIRVLRKGRWAWEGSLAELRAGGGGDLSDAVVSLLRNDRDKPPMPSEEKTS